MIKPEDVNVLAAAVAAVRPAKMAGQPPETPRQVAERESHRSAYKHPAPKLEAQEKEGTLELCDFKAKTRYATVDEIITLERRPDEHVGNVISRMIETVHSPIKNLDLFEVQVRGNEVKLRPSDREETPLETIARVRAEKPRMTDINIVGVFYTAFREFINGDAPTPGLRFLETYAEFVLDIIGKYVSEQQIANVSDNGPMSELFSGQRILWEELDKIVVSQMFPLGHEVTLIDVINMANANGYFSAEDFGKLVFPGSETINTAGNHALLKSKREFKSWEEVLASRKLSPGEFYYYIKTVAKSLLTEIEFAREGSKDRSAARLRNLTGKLSGAVRCFFDDDYPDEICG